MKKTGESLLLSASDLVGHLNCRHLTHLESEALRLCQRRPVFHDPMLEILMQRGAIHEANYVNQLVDSGYQAVRISGVGVMKDFVDDTLEAMRSGVQVIVQPAFQCGIWGGRADVLRRISEPSALGDWSYEVIDTKLARETKAGTILQLCLYADLLGEIQGRRPEFVYVVTPGADFVVQRYRTTAFAAYYRSVKVGLEQSLSSGALSSVYPDPKEHCEICSWRVACQARRREDDHLCLVAGITKVQIAELRRNGIHTVRGLSTLPLPLPWKPERGVRESYERSREQARMQVLARATGKPEYETIDPQPGVGMANLPAPSAGDVFLDLEADPFVGDCGLEYLFGYVFLDDAGMPLYENSWALSRAEERATFERFVDFVILRWARFPNMHVYHYASYEPGALKRLMGRYASREDEIDRMLRGRLFVDLYSVVRQGIRASVESYSIKNLEQFYEFTRTTPLDQARSALVVVESALELDDAAGIDSGARDVVAGYNQDDCISALRLRNWLEGIRSWLIDQRNSIDRPAAVSAEPTQELSERQIRVAALVSELIADIPDDRVARSAEQQARWLLANVLDWHRRESKSAWWERFRLAALPSEELLDERDAASGLAFVGSVGGTTKAPIHRYAFPPQDIELRGGETLFAVGGSKLGKVEAVSLEQRTIDIKKRQDTASVHPVAAFASDVVSSDVLAEALLRIGNDVVEHGMVGGERYIPARDLLLCEPPRLGAEPLRQPGESVVEAAVRVCSSLPCGVLPIQGPPGAGKTFAAARMICALAKAGKRIGVTANSHKVIRNLLDKVVEAADELNVDLVCVQKAADVQEDIHRIRFANSNEDVFAVLGPQCQVAAGTAWLWSREDAFESVDVLFVDEAAQMALANVLAVSQACRTLVLLGDPRQLEQPTQGSHPEGTDVSALDHILNGRPTIGSEQGLFLEETWRLHPSICEFTSELFYEGRLRPRAGLERQVLRSTARVTGAGLRFLPVTHEGNQSSSPEEADRIRDLVQEILGSNATWVDRRGVEAAVRLKDILVIAPYNAQVFELQERLPGARTGTVDKFQGQEAAIVIYSMTTSSSADAPRGMEFLYSLNRLNVATSRAMCICVLVGSPAIFEPECRTPRQMELANGFCRYFELAQVL